MGVVVFYMKSSISGRLWLLMLFITCNICRVTSLEELPKSQSLNSPELLTRTFSSFISRCAIPLECMWESPAATALMIFRMVFSGTLSGYFSRILNAVLSYRYDGTLWDNSPTTWSRHCLLLFSAIYWKLFWLYSGASTLARHSYLASLILLIGIGHLDVTIWQNLHLADCFRTTGWVNHWESSFTQLFPQSVLAPTCF